MTTPPPRVFISATSGDLRSVRQLVKEALLTMDCLPVEQTNFPPDWRTVEDMLRERIAGCQAMIHIAGFRYGAEPVEATLPPGTARRSYTQIEYHLGCRLQDERGDDGFRVYSLVCGGDFPYDPCADPEPEEKASLQLAHRAALADSPRLYERPSTPEALLSRVLALREQVLAIRREQAEVKREVVATRRFGVRAFAAILLALAILGASLFLISRKQDELAVAHRTDASAIKALLEQSFERALEEFIASSSDEFRHAEPEGVSEAAHQIRLSQIDRRVSRLVELSTAREANPVIVEMTRLLADNGVDAALNYWGSQCDGIRAEVRSTRESERQNARDKLQPFLQAAALQSISGRPDDARRTYLEIISLEPDWPEALAEISSFLNDEAKLAKMRGKPAPAVSGAKKLQNPSPHGMAPDAGEPGAHRLLSDALAQIDNSDAPQNDVPKSPQHITQTYTGFLAETPIIVRLTWENPGELGRIWGSISFDGRTLEFKGENDSSGHIFFQDSDGDLYDLRKEITSSTMGWQGTVNGSTKVTILRKRQE